MRDHPTQRKAPAQPSPDVDLGPYLTRKRRTVGRKIEHNTALAQKVRDSGRPAYLIGAQAGIQPTRMYEYVAGRKPLRGVHLRRLCAIFGCEPVDLVE